MAESYHLWRTYTTAPYYRWACEVVADPEAPDGYRVERHDPQVADTMLFHRLQASLEQPVTVLIGEEHPWGTSDSLTTLIPGDAEHFGAALRNVAGTIVGQSPEYMEGL